MAEAAVKDIKEFFGLNMAEMKAEWLGKDNVGNPVTTPTLTAEDKKQILEGLGNGTLTY